MLAANLALVTAYLYRYSKNPMKVYVSGGFFLLAAIGGIISYVKNREPAAEEKTLITEKKPVLAAKKAPAKGSAMRR